MTDGIESQAVAEIDLNGKPLSVALRELEKKYLAHVMTQADGNKAQAARMAGVTYDTFLKKIKGWTCRAVYHFE